MVRWQNKRSRALIVGLGSMGRRHLANLRQLLPQGDITVLRHDPASAGNDTSTHLANRVVFQLDQALAQSPELAIITSPSPFHLDTALALAELGVHLCIEKPLSDQLRGIDELIALCARRQLVLLVGYTLRFYEPLRVLRGVLQQGRLGRVVSLRAEVGQYLPDWRPGVDYRRTASARQELGGGVLLELSHELDYARWLLGDVEHVYAHVTRSSDLEIDVEDLAEITLHFRSGAVGNIHLDMVQTWPTRTCRIIGTDGTLTWDGQDHGVRLYCARQGRWSDLYAPSVVDRNAMYLAELAHFLECVYAGARPEVTGEDGKRALELALAAKRSSKLRQAVELRP